MTAATSFATRMTPNGRGAVATVRLKGDFALLDGESALFHAANRLPISRQTVGRVLFGRWGVVESEDVVVCRIDDSTLDIHCHGGDAAAARILSDLESRGCEIVDWQKMVAESAGYLHAELLEALSRATTLRTAEILLEQQSGVLEAAVSQLLATEMSLAAATLKAMLGLADFGLHLSTPWNVVLFGRPNVGKSSLINALVGYSRSIVFEEPGTTRDVVTAETAFEGWPIRLADTAGIRDEAETLELSGIERARQHIADADCRVLLIDTSRAPHDDDRRFLAAVPEAIVVAHKCDLADVWGSETPEHAIRVSSLTGAGVDRLAKQIVSTMVSEIPSGGIPIPVTQRQVELLQRALDAIETSDEPQFRDALKTILAPSTPQAVNDESLRR